MFIAAVYKVNKNVTHVINENIDIRSTAAEVSLYLKCN